MTNCIVVTPAVAVILAWALPSVLRLVLGFVLVALLAFKILQAPEGPAHLAQMIIAIFGRVRSGAGNDEATGWMARIRERLASMLSH